MGNWFLREAAVVIHLEEDGEVHKDLQKATGPELNGSLSEQEVSRLKGVAAGPHQHHLDTHALCGLVLVVAVELRGSQHRLSEDSQETEGLHEKHRVQEEVSGVGGYQREGQHALHVVQEATPQPEGAPVKVYEGASLGAEFSGRADVCAQVQHDEHGEDHDDALPQQQRLEVTAKSEEYPEDVSHQKDQAHICGEALSVLGPADVSVLRDVGHQSPENHGTSSHPSYQAVKHGHNLIKHLILHLQMTPRRCEVTSPGLIDTRIVI